MSTIMVERKDADFRQIGRNEPEWLYNLRKDGWVSYHGMPLPDPVAHLWRYTDPVNFMIDNPADMMKVLPALSDITEREGSLMKPEYSAYGYNRSDFMTFALLDRSLADSGVVFEDLYSAITRYEDLVRGRFGHLVNADFGKFEAMNFALWNTGLFLYVPDNTIIEKPVRLQRHPSSPKTFLRLLAVIGKNSEVTIIDDYSGECRKEDATLNSVVEIFAGESSRIHYAAIQRLAENCVSHITQRSRAGRDARIDSIFGAFGGNISKVNAGTILDGRGAQSNIHGVVFGNNHQHFDYHTMHHHRDDESHSDIDFKVLLKDKSTSAYTGLIRIDEDALNCEAYQMNRNLLLNRGPKAESIPELEILCDQVRCSHGATMGPIDPEMIFYLKSRGLSHNEAVRTVVSGFIEPTLNRLPADSAEIIRNLMMTKLKGL